MIIRYTAPSGVRVTSCRAPYPHPQGIIRYAVLSYSLWIRHIIADLRSNR